MNKTIGILGGMGPMATCDLMKKIIDHTEASRDQDYPRICVDCNTNIPDRTAAILGKGADPRPEMIKGAVRLQNMGADVIIVSCNTAHYFLEDVKKCVDIPVLHMPKETAAYLREQGVGTAAVLATDGTVKIGLYDQALRELGITPVYPDPEDQAMIMSVIYDYVKAGKDYPYPEKIEKMQQRLAEKGAERMILGCTELPIAFAQWETQIPTVDPTDILALAAIRFTGCPSKA
jgi:aspartate racemase